MKKIEIRKKALINLKAIREEIVKNGGNDAKLAELRKRIEATLTANKVSFVPLIDVNVGSEASTLPSDFNIFSNGLEAYQKENFKINGGPQ